ncbi:Txe/YoeB family addiction module toxin [Desulfovibrio sp. JY]|nr:Txe/YoeB family addiction module toxin [Desulfovibrio sp. JY]
MRLVWTPQAWEDYLSWQARDKAKCKKINALIREILREPFSGTGKPEPLKFDLAGCWSRRIDMEHRLVYLIEDGDCVIIACRYHY